MFSLLLPVLFATASLDSYLSYVEQLQDYCGKCAQGEIEIVLDPEKIHEIETGQKERLEKRGFTAEEASEYSRVGVAYEDQYLILLRDAVLFPSGGTGTYDRFIWKSKMRVGDGVAVLPVLPSGKIAMVLQYRHATRSWEMELPRGGMMAGETPRDAALRELREETGYEAATLHFLGKMAPDTGILNSVIPVYLAEVSSQGLTALEEGEAIDSVHLFTKEELREALLQGYVEVELKGEKRSIPVRDSFLTYALLQASHLGLNLF